jgi:hypothetical protein
MLLKKSQARRLGFWLHGNSARADGHKTIFFGSSAANYCPAPG